MAGPEPSPLCIVVGNAPRTYREALASAIRILRPEARVCLTEPEEIEVEVRRRRPQVVVCDHLSPLVERQVPAWLLLYPSGTRLSVVSIAGEQTEVGDFTLDQLVELLDRAATLPPCSDKGCPLL